MKKLREKAKKLWWFTLSLVMVMVDPDSGMGLGRKRMFNGPARSKCDRPGTKIHYRGLCFVHTFKNVLSDGKAFPLNSSTSRITGLLIRHFNFRLENWRAWRSPFDTSGYVNPCGQCIPRSKQWTQQHISNCPAGIGSIDVATFYRGLHLKSKHRICARAIKTQTIVFGGGCTQFDVHVPPWPYKPIGIPRLLIRRAQGPA
ncbi:hypothetical protein FA15DRAFT_652099 [Coprinopsis marcescibilis]|uniref:Uncharacterized protein n=1 Tax=Coprinopsis marcescibilis TaxID=230819 RepID=A0A5C3L9S1_COPMA|nr:hypothetical protein FA15DRAFT_652099 [Coprinopsis marcescibilis]